MKVLFFTSLLMFTISTFASESFFDTGTPPESVLRGGFEAGFDLPFGTNYTENYDPAIHLRYFILDDVSLGFYGRWSEGKLTNRYSVGPSIRAYFLSLGPVDFTISQTFALASTRAKSSINKEQYNDSTFQSIARIGFQVDLGKGFALGYELNNHSVIEESENISSYYESRLNLYYHHGRETVTETTGLPYPEKISDERKLSSQYLFGSRSMGHILASNASTLNKGEFSFGTLYTGYAISDSWTIVTSPFAYLAYDLFTLVSRHGHDISPTERIGFEATHYKSVNPKKETRFYDGQFQEATTKTGFDTFKMEASSLKLTYSKLLFPSYRFNLTASYFYYFDEDRPFSLRMDPQNSDPFSVSITSLHEFKVANDFFISAELGSWGLNYHYPYYHVGLSLNMQRKHIYLGIGASATFNFNIPDDKLKKFAGYDSQWSIHPELQAQLFF